VVTALDRPALAQLGNGGLEPSCYLIPEGIPGHPSGSCPYGGADDEGDLAEARELVQRSGTAGTSVIVWGENGAPERAYVRSYTKLLNRLGYRAKTQLLPPASYFARVGSAKLNPQTGFGRWYNDFPNPADFYEVVNADSIGATPTSNLGRINDIFIQQQLSELNLFPAQEIGSAAGQWRELEEYTAKKAYLAVFGIQEIPKLMSERMNFNSAVVHPLFLSDWSTWSLK
jgi:peptide/nickel transport system substrate-binding protein